jgi:putative ABC transport system substrate-binding protein
VVFVTEIDPAIIGFVEEWARPGGNYTGISIYTRSASTEGRRLELLLDLDPTIKKIWVPYDSTEISASIKRSVIQNAADILEVELVYHAFESDTDLSLIVSEMPDDVDAIFTFSEKVYALESAVVLPNVAMMHRVPYSGATVQYGAVMSYGPNWYAVGEQAARLTNQILSGIPPSDLPVEPSDFVLSINLKTAQAIGLEVPDTMLQQANIIIR